jgi:hypothetical protein
MTGLVRESLPAAVVSKLTHTWNQRVDGIISIVLPAAPSDAQYKYFPLYSMFPAAAAAHHDQIQTARASLCSPLMEVNETLLSHDLIIIIHASYGSIYLLKKMCGLLAFSASVLDLGSPSGRASNVTPGQYLVHLLLWLAGAIYVVTMCFRFFVFLQAQLVEEAIRWSWLARPYIGRLNFPEIRRCFKFFF